MKQKFLLYSCTGHSHYCIKYFQRRSFRVDIIDSSRVIPAMCPRRYFLVLHTISHAGCIRLLCRIKIARPPRLPKLEPASPVCQLTILWATGFLIIVKHRLHQTHSTKATQAYGTQENKAHSFITRS